MHVSQQWDDCCMSGEGERCLGYLNGAMYMFFFYTHSNTFPTMQVYLALLSELCQTTCPCPCNIHREGGQARLVDDLHWCVCVLKSGPSLGTRVQLLHGLLGRWC